jgi:hypothetical protein
MIQITDKLVAVLVPDDACEYSINHPNLETEDIEDIYTILRCWHKKGLSTIELSDDTNLKFKIIGTITKSGEFDFDCETYIRRVERFDTNIKHFTDYTNTKSGEFDFDCETYIRRVERFDTNIKHFTDYTNTKQFLISKKSSFISLLHSKGVVLEELDTKKLLILEKTI